MTEVTKRKKIHSLEQFSKMRWKTIDGRIIKIVDLKDDHLANIINYILKNPKAYPNRDELITWFHIEAEARGLTIQYLEGAPYGFSDYEKEKKDG